MATVTTKLASPAEQNRLHEALEEFDEAFDMRVQTAVSQLKRRGGNPAMRDAATQWQIMVINRGAAFLKNPSPAAGLLDYWGLCERQKQYLQTGVGADLFGEHQGIAIEAAADVEKQISELAAAFFSEKEHAALKAAVATYAMANPMGGVFADEKQSATFTMASEGLGAISSGLSMVLSPLTAVGSTVTSVADLPASVDRIADILEGYPRELFLQLELTASSLLGEAGVASIIESIDRTSRSVEQLAATADRLPQDVQTIVRTTLEESVAALPEVRATLESTNATLQTVDGITTEAKQIVVQLEALTKSLESLVVAAGVVIDKLPKPEPGSAAPPPPAPTEPARPFDVTEYTQAVEALTGTVEQLRGTIVETRELIESTGIPNALETLNAEVIASSAASVGSLVDRVTWRVGQLLVLLFALLIVTRVATRFIRGRGPTATGGA